MSDYGINGYLDIGLIDTMKDMMINFFRRCNILNNRLFISNRQSQREVYRMYSSKFTELSKNNSNGKSLTNIKENRRFNSKNK